jgi:type IV pilus assembly protein PilZ
MDAENKSRAWMHSLTVSEKTKAAELWMPFVKRGGFFLATDKKYALGDSVFVLLTLGDEGRKFPVNGKVVWLCPEGARGDRQQGVGIQFPSDAMGDAARGEFEAMAGKIHTSLKKTATL